jgi:hypothetical protein
MTWVNFATKEFGIFDSVPELQSYYWAEPVSSNLTEPLITTLSDLE